MPTIIQKLVNSFNNFQHFAIFIPKFLHLLLLLLLIIIIFILIVVKKVYSKIKCNISAKINTSLKYQYQCSGYLNHHAFFVQIQGMGQSRSFLVMSYACNTHGLSKLCVIFTLIIFSSFLCHTESPNHRFVQFQIRSNISVYLLRIKHPPSNRKGEGPSTFLKFLSVILDTSCTVL